MPGSISWGAVLSKPALVLQDNGVNAIGNIGYYTNGAGPAYGTAGILPGSILSDAFGVLPGSWRNIANGTSAAGVASHFQRVA